MPGRELKFLLPVIVAKFIIKVHCYYYRSIKFFLPGLLLKDVLWIREKNLEKGKGFKPLLNLSLSKEI
jgi:hypothetical protein